MKRKFLGRALLVQVAAVLFIFGSAFAVPIGTVDISIQTPLSMPADGLVVEVVDASSNVLDVLTTDSAGSIQLFGYEEGTYDLKLTPSLSSLLPNNGRFLDSTIPVTFSVTDPAYNSPMDLLTIIGISLVNSNRYFRLVVNETTPPAPISTNAVGDPVVGAMVDFISVADPSIAFSTMTNPMGEAFFSLGALDTSSYDIIVSRAGFGSNQITAAPQGPGATDITMGLAVADASIQINLIDAATTSPLAIGTGEFGDINCYSLDGQNAFNTFLSPGDTSGTVMVFGGSYNCDVNVSDRGAVQVSVTVGPAGSVSTDAVFEVIDSHIQVNLIDGASSAPLAVPSSGYSDVNCSRNDGSRSFNRPFTAGETFGVVDVIAGTYDCFVTVDGYQSIDFSVTAVSGMTVQVDSIQVQANATVQVSFVDGSGNSFGIPAGTSGNFSCNGQSSGYDGSAPLSAGDTSASLLLVAGPYECQIEVFGFGMITKLVAAIANQTVNETVVVDTPDSTIAVKLLDEATGAAYSVPAGKQGDVHCQRSDESFSAGSPLEPGDSEVNLQVKAGTYECGAFVEGAPPVNKTVVVASQQTANFEASFSVPDATIAVSLVDQANAAFSMPTGVFGNVFCNAVNKPEGFDAFVDSGVSSVNIGVRAGLFDCELGGPGLSSNRQRVLVASGATAAVQLAVVQADANIVVNLVDSAGAAFTLPSDSPGFVGCEDRSAQRHFGAPFEPGESSATVQVIAGNYDCFVGIDGLGGQRVSGQVASGATITLSSQIFQRNASIKLRILDATTNQMITGVGAEFSIATTTRQAGGVVVEDRAFGFSDTGETTLSAVGGQIYEADVFLIGESVQYTMPRQLATVLTVDGQVSSVDFVLTRTTSVAKVRLLDAEGNLVMSGWAEAFSQGTSPSSPEVGSLSTVVINNTATEDRWSGVPIANGEGLLPLVAGREYEIRAFPEFVPGSRNVAPSGQRVTLAENETREISLQIRAADHVVSIQTTISSSSGISDSDQRTFFGCYGFRGEEHTFVEVESGRTAELPLFYGSNTANWDVGCYVVVGDLGNEKFFQAETTYEREAGAATGSLILVLAEGETYFPKESFTFDVTRENSFTVNENTTIEIPARAIGDSGTATMTVGSGTGYTFRESDYPLFTADIKFELNNQEVSQTEQPVTILFKVSKSKLEELGVELDQVRISSFEETSRVWRQDAAYTVYEDPEDSTKIIVAASLNHFSLWGNLIERAEELAKGIATDLVAVVLGKKKKRKLSKVHRVKLGWTEPTDVAGNADVVYEVRVAKTTKKAECDFTDATTYEVTGEAFKKLKFRKKRKKKWYAFDVKIAGGTASACEKFKVPRRRR